MFSKNLLLLTVLMSMSAFAVNKNTGKCQYIGGVRTGLNIKNYEQCSEKINSCPKVSQISFNNDCVRKVVHEEQACRQLDKLAKFINVTPDMISAKQKGNMTLLDVSFAADGGHLYYILSPKGCLIATNVDPRDISQKVKHQYSQADFYIDARGEPTYTSSNGMQRFTAAIDAKKQCRACQVIATAEINFDFNANGTWLKTSLGQFETK